MNIDAEILNKILATQILATSRAPYITIDLSLIVRVAQRLQINKCLQSLQQNEEQYHMIVSLDAEKTSDKIQCPFMIRKKK